VSHPLLVRLAGADPAERRAACLAAPADPAAALLVEALGLALGDPDRSVSRAASDALAAIGRRERAVQDVLRDALRSDSPARRFAAAYTSVRLAPPHPGLLPPLVEALASEDGDVRWSAAKILVDLGRLHGDVLGVLLGLARGADAPAARRMAAFCLRELAPDHPETARVLLGATHDPDAAVRRASFTALAALLDPPDAVRARLREALGADADLAVRRIAATALGALAAQGAAGLDPDSEAALVAATASTDAVLRRAAERALGRRASAAAARDAAAPHGGPPS
jgi:HEAT repeat protein